MSDYDEKAVESKHQAELQRWSRKKMRLEDDHEGAISAFKQLAKEALKNVQTRRNLANEFLDGYKNPQRPNYKNESGFGNAVTDDDEVITGLERFPWERY